MNVLAWLLTFALVDLPLLLAVGLWRRSRRRRRAFLGLVLSYGYLPPGRVA